MIFQGKYEFLLQLCGLHSGGGLSNIIVRIVYWIFFGLFTVVTTIYLTLNRHRDFIRISSNVTIVLASTATFAIYFHLLLTRNQLHALLNELQEIVHECKRKIILKTVDDNFLIFLIFFRGRKRRNEQDDLR